MASFVVVSRLSPAARGQPGREVQRQVRSAESLGLGQALSADVTLIADRIGERHIANLREERKLSKPTVDLGNDEIAIEDVGEAVAH